MVTRPHVPIALSCCCISPHAGRRVPQNTPKPPPASQEAPPHQTQQTPEERNAYSVLFKVLDSYFIFIYYYYFLCNTTILFQLPHALEQGPSLSRTPTAQGCSIKVHVNTSGPIPSDLRMPEESLPKSQLLLKKAESPQAPGARLKVQWSSPFVQKAFAEKNP